MGMVGLPTEEAFDYSINEIIKAKNTDVITILELSDSDLIVVVIDISMKYQV